MQKKQVISFIESYSKETHTEEEHQAFADWLQNAPIEDIETIAEEYRIIAESRPSTAYPNEHLMALVEEALDQSDPGITQVEKQESSTPVIRMWKKITVAAALVGLVGLGLWFFIKEDSTGKQSIAENKPSDIQAPKMTRAMITLSDGTTVALDSVASGMLALQSNVRVLKNERGEIFYQALNEPAQGDIQFNTLYNPRGSKVIALALSDGTKVWLNNESSLRYPTAFAGNERTVEIIGEAYFEVAHNTSKPFFVKQNDVQVQVLGTHFNVNAYQDEEAIKVTLLEGSVSVQLTSTDQQSVILKPGQQAKAEKDQLTTLNGVDLDEIMAWKEGQFIYTNTDLPTIMRQMARWYDIEVVFQDKVTDKYTVVNVSRDVPVSKLFQFIEMSGGVRFEIEGKKVIVKK